MLIFNRYRVGSRYREVEEVVKVRVQGIRVAMIAAAATLLAVVGIGGWLAFASGGMGGHIAMGSGMMGRGMAHCVQLMGSMHGSMGIGAQSGERIPEMDSGLNLERVTASVQLDEWMLTPSILELEGDQRLVLTIENRGTAGHAFAIPDLGVRVGPLAPGTVRTIELDLTEPGTYEVFCDIPGHRQLGQSGTLIIH